MSNCDFVAGRSLIALVASRLALRAPARRAASALTRPNQSARWLPSGRHGVPTVKVGRAARRMQEESVMKWWRPAPASPGSSKLRFQLCQNCPGQRDRRPGEWVPTSIRPSIPSTKVLDGIAPASTA